MMKTLLLLFFTLACAVANTPSHAQNVPTDLKISATAGGLIPGSSYRTVRVTADGQLTYDQIASDDYEAPPIQSGAVTVSPAQLEQLWQIIEANDFFTLNRRYSNDAVIDGSFAQLIITANGATHTVTTQNIAVSRFDAIIDAINDLIPAEMLLEYNMDPPPDFVPRDICEPGAGKGSLSMNKKSDKNASLHGTTAGAPRSNASFKSGAHAGTVVGYRISLQDAVNLGIVSLSGKGDVVYGDAVSIHADNSSGVTTDRLSLSVYLELYGPVAVPEIALDVKNAIENEWGGKTTSDGKVLGVDVFTRTLLGATAPPGTAGYHQVKMVTGEFVSFVTGNFGINSGAGGGTWSINGNAVNETYAHEAGHLFGLEDRYDEYEKQADGSWVNTETGVELTAEELAKKIDPHSELTEEQLIEKLRDEKRKRATVPIEGAGDDIMATVKEQADPSQSDIDGFAAQAGLIIEIRPGNILVNKDGTQQNYLITRWEDLFVPFGGEAQLDGIYAACIDLNKDIPTAGVGFDVAPPLSEWVGIEAAPVLQQLVDYINAQDAFCPSEDIVAQEAIWRITDNDALGDDDVETFVSNAGITFGDRIFDFPRISNSNADNPETTALTPPELFVPQITWTGDDIFSPGESVTLNGSLIAPAGQNVSPAYNWTLNGPPGSFATLTSSTGESTSFTADARGFYRVVLEATFSSPTMSSQTVEKRLLLAFPDTDTETFESGVLRTGRPYFWETDPQLPWTIATNAVNSGSYSVMSPDISSDESTSLTVRFTQGAADPFMLAFKLSSELNYDFFSVAVNGVVRGAFSGEIDWLGLIIPLDAGEHAITFSYEKDDSRSIGADAVWIDNVFFPKSAIFTSVESHSTKAPDSYSLSQNYPNPFYSITTVAYSLPEEAHVTLAVYDALGRQVARLVDDLQPPGRYLLPFDAGALSSGLYYYELRAGTFASRRAMIVAR